MPTNLLATDLKHLLTTDQPPELGPDRRASAWTEAVVSNAIQNALDTTKLPVEAGQLIRCVVLLWHDNLEAAHHLAQGIDTPAGSWLHGIVHRREPDYANAKYWFRRVGAHPAFIQLSHRARPLLEKTEFSQLSSRIMKSGGWDPLAFIEAVAAVSGPRGTDPERACLRQLQAMELQTTLDYFAAR